MQPQPMMHQPMMARPPRPGFPPMMAHPPRPPAKAPSEDEPPAKKAKTEDQLIPEDVFLSRNRVRFCVLEIDPYIVWLVVLI